MFQGFSYGEHAPLGCNVLRFEGFEMFQGFQVFQGYRCFKVTQLQCHAGSCFVVPSRNDYDEGTGLQFV